MIETTSGGLLDWDPFRSEDDMYQLLIGLAAAVVLMIILGVCLCARCKRKRQEKETLAEQKRMEQDVFREQITMDVTEND